MDISKKTLEEIKALAYDQFVLFEQTKNNLAILNAEIEKRAKEEKKK